MLRIAAFGILQGSMNLSVVEVVLADDVAGPSLGTNQHAEVVSGPVSIIVCSCVKNLLSCRKAPKDNHNGDPICGTLKFWAKVTSDKSLTLVDSTLVIRS